MPGTTEKPSQSTTNPASIDATGSENPTRQAATSAVDQDQRRSGSGATQQTQSQVEEAAAKLYEERIEDEYAKREGGA